MDRMREQPLACPGFPLDQDGWLAETPSPRPEHPPNLIPQGLDARISADQLSEKGPVWPVYHGGPELWRWWLILATLIEPPPGRGARLLIFQSSLMARPLPLRIRRPPHRRGDGWVIRPAWQ